MAAAQKLEISPVAQVLQLLPDFLLHMPIVRKDAAQARFEAIDLVEVKVRFADLFYTFHHLDQPAPGFQALVSKEQCLLPFLQNEIAGNVQTFSPVINLADLGNAVEQDVATDPPGPASGSRQWWPFLDD